jgi:hypothetical protein
MKKIIINYTVTFLLELIVSQITLAQGTITYLSNLGQISSGSSSVGSNLWLAVPFQTGSNGGGYILNSIDLEMLNASGSPAGFTVMLYGEANNPGGVLPGASLGTLTGPVNPSTSGIYAYSDVSNFTLSPGVNYFIVLTAATATANGAYAWSSTSTGSYSSYNPIGGWFGGGPALFSGNGLSWTVLSGAYTQFAINATAIPEPGVLSLFVLGGLGFLWQRRKAKAL